MVGGRHLGWLINFKMHMMHCTKTNLARKIEIHTQDKSVKDNIEKVVAEDEAEEEVNKMNSLSSEVCRPLLFKI
jgi:hypothetical protein